MGSVLDPVILAALAVRWLQVPGFPDYWVSSHGLIMSLRPDRWGRAHPRIMAGWASGRSLDRFRVPLRNVRGAPPTLKPVHRIVCEAFHGPPPPGKNMACHKDGNAHNNSAANLYWGDAYDNARDRWRKEDEDELRAQCAYDVVPVWTEDGELVPF